MHEVEQPCCKYEEESPQKRNLGSWWHHGAPILPLKYLMLDLSHEKNKSLIWLSHWSWISATGSQANPKQYTKAYLVLLGFTYWASQILHFLHIEGLWQSCIKQVYQCHFSNSICSLHDSVSHFGNSHNTSNFFVIIFVMVICDQWSWMLLLWLAEGSDEG